MDGGEEPRILPHLLQEMRAQVEARAREEGNSSLHAAGTDHRDERGDLVHSMIENYKSHVKGQYPPAPHQSPPPPQFIAVAVGKTKSHLSRVVKKASLTTSRAHLPPVHSYSNPAQTNETLNAMSHSQPCLNTAYSFTSQPQPLRMPPPYQAPPQLPNPRQQRPLENLELSQPSSAQSGDGSRSAASEIVVLRQQVASMQRKCEKFEQLESAYHRIENEFEELLSQKERESALENSILQKMQRHIEHLQAENQCLQQKVTEQTQRSGSCSVAEVEEEEQQDRCRLEEELAALSSRSQQQKLEIEAQNATLEEQRNHIDVLEKALSNAQERIGVRDRQMVDMTAVADRCTQLQGLLDATTAENEKAKEEWRRREAALGIELARLRVRLEQDSSVDVVPPRIHSAPSFATHGLSVVADAERRMEAMKSEIRGRDETIRSLEARVEEFRSRLVDGNGHGHGLDEDMGRRIVGGRQLNWEGDRRNLDQRVRLLEHDIKQLIGSEDHTSACLPPRTVGGEDEEGDNFILLQPPHHAYNGGYQEGDGGMTVKEKTAPCMQKASSMWERMEELRKKIAERRFVGDKSEEGSGVSNIPSSGASSQLLHGATAYVQPQMGNVAHVNVGQIPSTSSSSPRRLSALSLPRIEGPLASYIETLTSPPTTGQEQRRAENGTGFIHSPFRGQTNRDENENAMNYSTGNQRTNSTTDALKRYGEVSRIDLTDKNGSAGYSSTIVEVNRDHLVVDPLRARTGSSHPPTSNTRRPSAPHTTANNVL